MTNEVKNVPELRFPEFSEEWEEKILDEVSTFSKGKGISKNDLSKDGTSCILYGELYTTYDFIINKIKSKTLLDTKNLVKGKKNQVLIPSSGETPLDIATAAVINTTEDMLLGGDINVLTPVQKYDGKFISLSINGKNKSNLSKYAQGKSVVHLYNNDIKKLKIKFPVKNSEQRKIGDFFSKLDRQIELEEQKLEKLEEQKKGYMQKFFSQELRFKDENGNDYPEWEEKKLGDILERGNKDKVDEIGKYRRLTISLHGKGLYEVKQERKTKDTRPFYQRFEGELIIGKQNFFNGSIAIVTREFNGFICSNAIMSYKISNHMNRKYLLEYLLQNDFLRKNEYLADGTGQKELSEKKFEELEIKLPNSINEQQKIGVFLERLDNLIEKQSNKLELLKQRKKSFLQKMFV
ncbi:restriction endonuclease subunit S [Staphylococcus arlettae]|uniref:restriction endonuclease subunit S n=1 Tax=Staphylococcus arlettae TaxID=29378 RepID=UPI001E349916|nr:restriction endonuclease subunit S [Staphylococcus arlettae]MCD8841196.1 restriction endonuclease subunit S [Staphylococcus arlettae]